MENQYLIDKNRYDDGVKNGIYPEKILIEKQVWESTLHRSMVLQAENEQLKEEVSRESYKVSEAYCYVEELKELLKECKEYMQDIQGQIEEDEYTMARNTAKLVKTKIDEALK